MTIRAKPAPPAKPDPALTHLIKEFKHPSPLIGCRIDPAGAHVFATAQDSSVQRWNLATGKQASLAGHKSWVRGLAFAAKEKLLITGDYAGAVLFWPAEADAPKPVRTIAAHQGWVQALAVSPDGRLLATGGNDRLVKLWSLPDGRLVRDLPGHASHVYNLAFHPAGKFLVSVDLLGVVKQWDLAKGTIVRDLDASVLHKYDPVFRADIGGARGIAFNSEVTLLACAGITDVSNAFAGIGKPVVVLFDWQSGKRKQLLVPKEAFQGTAWAVAIHRDGFIVGAGGGNGGALWFWKPEQAPAFFTFKLPANARDMTLHPDVQRLAVACADGAVRLYGMVK